MNAERFSAPNARDALKLVRARFGDQAIILSSKYSAEEGAVIMAASEDAFPIEDAAAPARLSVIPAPAPAPKRAFVAEPMAAEPMHQLTAIFQDIRSMGDQLQSQMAQMSWSTTQMRSPAKAEIVTTMVSAGYSPALSRKISDSLNDNVTSDDAMRQVSALLESNIDTSDYEEMLEHGGVFAIVGPTGVGKTTTTAKLAARYVMKHGADKLALISTDSYRIGGHEQLRTYGKILGVMVHSVKDELELKIALNELRNKHTILIDTVGVSQRDRMVTEQVSMLQNVSPDIKKLLCLNATCTSETLTDVYSAYRSSGVTGCIITKIDETANMGSALDVVIREGIKVYYVTNGQRVPEDLHVPNKQYLVHTSFRLGAKKHDLFNLKSEEMPSLMGNLHRLESAHV